MLLDKKLDTYSYIFSTQMVPLVPTGTNLLNTCREVTGIFVLLDKNFPRTSYELVFDAERGLQ